MNLRGFSFENRSLHFLHANSAQEAKLILEQHSDIALALIDVVMETDDAGLNLVKYIRDELNNNMIRLVIRTGQPGLSPERYVIDHFDIDDYKDKTELTTEKLYTTVRSALKAYRDLQAIDMNRIGLLSILDATPKIYDHSHQSLHNFFQGILTQVIALYNLDTNAIISTLDSVVATIDDEEIKIRAGTGIFENTDDDNMRLNELIKMCSDAVTLDKTDLKLRESSIILSLNVEDKPVGFIYLEPINHLSRADFNLIKLFANQCSAALESFKLHFDLVKSFNHAIDMLAVISEFRDSDTGEHINRISMYTTIISLEMGHSPEKAELYGQAARLHDVGKVGIPDNILLKEGKLTADEFEIIKTHTNIGQAILDGDEQFKLACKVSYSHHERWDGKGYPDGLKGEKIPVIARIVAVTDVFDALISKRPYKEAWSCEKAIEEIANCSGTQFDPEIVQVFLKLYQKGRFDSIISSIET